MASYLLLKIALHKQKNTQEIPCAVIHDSGKEQKQQYTDSKHYENNSHFFLGYSVAQSLYDILVVVCSAFPERTHGVKVMTFRSDETM